VLPQLPVVAAMGLTEKIIPLRHAFSLGTVYSTWIGYTGQFRILSPELPYSCPTHCFAMRGHNGCGIHLNLLRRWIFLIRYSSDGPVFERIGRRILG
jgi:hypothetical protein